jgi:hypothetical protein
MTLSIQPVQWSALPDLHEAPPLDDNDLECLEELRDVLARHRKLRRFAIHLAHRHFALGPGEILIERPDPDGRTQHVTVGRLEEEPEARPTTWLFGRSGAAALRGRLLHLRFRPQQDRSLYPARQEQISRRRTPERGGGERAADI